MRTVQVQRTVFMELGMVREVERTRAFTAGSTLLAAGGISMRFKGMVFMLMWLVMAVFSGEGTTTNTNGRTTRTEGTF